MKEAARQSGVFLAMLYAGLAAGILYDILRGFRRLLRAGPVLTGVLDVLFGLLSLLPAALLVICDLRLSVGLAGQLRHVDFNHANGGE